MTRKICFLLAAGSGVAAIIYERKGPDEDAR